MLVVHNRDHGGVVGIATKQYQLQLSQGQYWLGKSKLTPNKLSDWHQRLQKIAT